MAAPAHYGDYPTSAVVYMPFDTFAASTGAPTATSNFAAGDIQIYKNAGTTQRSSSNGITVTTSFDSNTGLQMVAIDTSDNTDAGFYAAGNEYQVAVADITADSQTLRFWLGCFSIERSGGVLALLKAGTAKCTLADGVAHGGTLGSSTATLALSRLNITSQTSNTSAVTATGNGTGHGIIASSGAGATGNGIQATAGSTNGHGLSATGAGTGDGIKGLGGATGPGMELVGGGTSGDGLKVTTTSGHGFNIAATGASKHGITSTGGDSGTSDGIKAVAGTGGVPIRGDITGNITGNLSGSVGSVTGAVGSVTGAVGSVTGNVGGNVVGSVASVTAAVATTSNIKKNQALTKFQFIMTDSTLHQPVSGKTVTCTRSIDGGAFGAGTLANVAEVSTAVGTYTVDFGSGDLNGNVIVLRATATSCDDTFERIVTVP